MTLQEVRNAVDNMPIPCSAHSIPYAVIDAIKAYNAEREHDAHIDIWKTSNGRWAICLKN